MALDDHVTLNTDGLTTPQVGYVISISRLEESTQWPITARLFFNQFEYLGLTRDGFAFIQQSPLSLGHSNDFLIRRYAKDGQAVEDGVFSTAEDGMPVGLVRVLADHGGDQPEWVDGVLWIDHDSIDYEEDTDEPILDGRSIFFNSIVGRFHEGALVFAPIDWKYRDHEKNNDLLVISQVLEAKSLEPYYRIEMEENRWFVRWNAGLLSRYLRRQQLDQNAFEANERE